MINIQNINGNECFKWSLVRYLHPIDPNLRIRKVDKLHGDKLHFKDIKFSSQDIHKIQRKNSISTSVSGYKDQKKYPIYMSKNVAKINMLIYY